MKITVTTTPLQLSRASARGSRMASPASTNRIPTVVFTAKKASGEHRLVAPGSDTSTEPD
jgi:hypothetical protein